MKTTSSTPPPSLRAFNATSNSVCRASGGDVSHSARGASSRRESPKKQTLERLACAAMVQINRERADNVRDFLDASPRGHAEPKNHAMAFAAKWTDCGRRDVYKGLWNDPAMSSAILALLGEAAEVLEQLTLAD